MWKTFGGKMNKIFQEYNQIVEKIKKQEEWLEKNKKKPDIDKYIQKFLNTIQESDNKIHEIEKILQRKMTSHEILEGFLDDR
jgi:prefoldin subunit 5